MTLSLLPTAYGKMRWYESETNNFSILEPMEWEALPEDSCPQAIACYTSDVASYTLMEVSTLELQRQDQTREGYVALLDSNLSSSPGSEKLSAETLTTVQGLVADRIDFTLGSGTNACCSVCIYRRTRKGWSSPLDRNPGESLLPSGTFDRTVD